MTSASRTIFSVDVPQANIEVSDITKMTPFIINLPRVMVKLVF
jgi:hypothetical protein